MKRTKVSTNVFVLALVIAVQAIAQVSPEATRFTITAAPILSRPAGEFGRNIGRSFGAGGGLLYHLDRAGFVSLRFDVSGAEYGHETKRVPLSQSVGQRIIVDLTTTNSITALSFGPELAAPRGAIRPYVDAGFSRLLFRTTSSIQGTNSSNEPVATTTNYSDGTNAWVFGGGARIPLLGNDPRKALSLDIGVRYHRGGNASYLREGSIQDQADGSIRMTPLSSRTPYLVYEIGIRYRIPHDPLAPCRRFLC